MNVQRLESYKSKLILFPRRADKPKKGDIHDSTAERLKSAEAAQQNTHNHVLEKPAARLRQAPQLITKEQRELRVFRKIRLVRTNKKYLGKREKRAKEAAEKEAEAKK
jgi:large subunit ribosomal protein L13e